MVLFKSFIVKEKECITSDLKKHGYKVEICLKKSDKGFRVLVRNNVPLHPSELERIEYRIQKAKSYNDFSEIYMDISDDQEGEGLGIPLTILFLKNSGLGEDSFSVRSNGRITQSAFTIPFSVKPLELTTMIQKQILGEVEKLPSFPEHIFELQKLCKKPDVKIKELSDKIAMDPSLTVSVLKLANSAGFFTSKRIEDLVDAVKIIGFKNLNSILITSSSRKILDDRFSTFSEVWNHSNKTAGYARLIAQKFRLNKISDRIVLAGLLHDLGKIVLLSANTELTNWIHDIASQRKMRSSTVIEEVSIGISHSTIGRLISKKWLLPEYITEAITYHHSPLCASEEYRDIVYVTYLANKMCLIEDKKFDFFYLEEEVLNKYNIKNEEDFSIFHNNIKEKYSNHSELN